MVLTQIPLSIKWLLREFKTRKKIVLVLDNATSHKSNKVIEFVSKHEERLDLLFLPPHSPELNPIERVWKNLRYLVTHNTYFENLETLENAVVEYLKDHFNPNKQLASLCCI
jgi:transposase